MHGAAHGARFTRVVKYDIPKIGTFKWLTYSYRYLNEESTEAFKRWVLLHDWAEVFKASRSQNKVVA